MSDSARGDRKDDLADVWDRLEGHRRVIVEVLDRQRLSTADVARTLGIDRSYLGKLRRGERPLTERIRADLVEMLHLDRCRLALAVDVMGRPSLYFDLTFRNLSYYARTMLVETMALSDSGGDMDCGIIIAAMTRERCELFARDSVKQLAQQFAMVSVFPQLGRSA